MRHLRSCWLLLLSLALASPGVVAADGLPSRTTQQAGVTVKVEPRALAPAGWDFHVTFDTHTQELKDDLLKSAVLVADGGKPAAPVAWNGDPPGGHHRKGVLRFAAVAPSPVQIELRIQRPGEPAARIFRWELGKR